MAAPSLDRIVAQLRQAVAPPGDGLTDGQLLGRYIAHRDEAAFAALVKRHGPMVLGVCRRMLGNAHDADDAFQAAFLVLVHKAGSLRSSEQVGNWLYGVAYNTALAARARRSRRRAAERQVDEMPEPTVAPPDDWAELRPLLDQELSQLAEVYREAVVLCDLEGKTRKEAARQLGVPVGTLSGRLTTARRELAARLARRGLALSGAALAVALSQGVASASVPAPLLTCTVKAGVAVATGPLAAGAVSAGALALTEGVLKTMFPSKVKSLVVLVLVLLLGAGGAIIGRALAAPAPGINKGPKKVDPDGPRTNGPVLIKKIVFAGSGSAVIRQTGNEMLRGVPVKPEDVKDGVLTVGGSKNVVVEIKELPEIVLMGSGSVRGENIRARRAALSILGSGDLRLSGTAEVQAIESAGSGKVDLSGLKGKRASVNIRGSGDTLVHVSEALKLVRTGSGGVHYIGTPKVEKAGAWPGAPGAPRLPGKGGLNGFKGLNGAFNGAFNR